MDLIPNSTDTEPVSYWCGKCNAVVKLYPRDIVKCHKCGFRILYKTYTKQSRIYLAI